MIISFAIYILFMAQISILNQSINLFRCFPHLPCPQNTLNHQNCFIYIYYNLVEKTSKCAEHTLGRFASKVSILSWEMGAKYSPRRWHCSRDLNGVRQHPLTLEAYILSSHLSYWMLTHPFCLIKCHFL